MKRILLFLLLTSVMIAGAMADVIDRVVATVDNQIILLSELDAQIQIFAIQNKLKIPNEAKLDSMRGVIFG